MPQSDEELAQLVQQLNRAKPKQPETARPVLLRPGQKAELGEILRTALRYQASDVLLVPDTPVCLRSHGKLEMLGGAHLASDQIRSLVEPLLNARQIQDLQAQRSIDVGFTDEHVGRARLNLHFQRGGLVASIRLLPARVPTFETLNLPSTLERLIERRQGLILVTGATGCGKSSTLAAFVNAINTRRCDHIITIEDPIEFLHSNQTSVVEQIEVGSDTPSFVASLRSILRQSPDVILVGEMRDCETVETVLRIAETGHLVLSTLHTNDATQAISRIVDAFPAPQQPQIRQQLSLALHAIICQQLVPGIDGKGRFPALEIMIATDAIRNLIRKSEDHQLYSQLSISRAEGMRTMEQSLSELLAARRITRETAMAHCFRADSMRRYLDV
ncbi:MAG TPA: PilT/PilU family type 4a pilus ATPase [Bryobacteraceae bacterium]|nr:PilT/PilU family type 4a pilus ATPase [Bryobacteraceae bacterium]